MAASPPRSRPAMAMADDNDRRRAAPFVAANNTRYAYGASSPEQHRSPRVHSSVPSRDSVISHPFSPKTSSPPSRSSIASSAARHHSRHLETERASHHSIAFPPRAQLDLEKQNGFPQSSQPRTHASLSDPQVLIPIANPRYEDDAPKMDVFKILAYLSGPCAVVSTIFMIWTILAIIITVVLQPLRFCSYRPTFNEQLCTFLAPPLSKQLRFIHSRARSNTYSSSMLVLVHSVSPFVAVGVAVASWVAAFFWFFSAILGDPAGQDGYNDGHTTVLSVRNWWERWLVRALSLPQL